MTEVEKENRQLVKTLVDTWEDYLVRGVYLVGEHWHVTLESGLSIDISRNYPRPDPGTTLRLYIEGEYGPVRGIDLDGIELFYESKEAFWERVRSRLITDDYTPI